MDEEDSQDELINRNASHGKGKRAAGWNISGSEEDSEEAGEEMEDEESESGDDDDEEEEDHLDGEDEEMEEEDDSDDDEEEEEEEDSGKAVEGAVAGASADPAELSSDEDSEKCPICLNSFHSQPVATPESCEHYFCLDCILEWSKNANSCPVDRIVFNNIYLRKNFGGKVQKMITVHKPVKEGQEEQVDLELEQTSCEVCRGRDREDRLLLCDGCDAGYHMECLTPPLDAVPVEEWFCPGCEANNRRSRGSAEDLSEAESQSSDRPTTSRSRPAPAGPTRAIARTQQSERVRANVNRHRITQARTAQLAPRFLMQSTWLDDTINAVVAGLNTAVYVRNLTPRAAPSRRRRTVKRRKGRKSTASGEKGKAAGTGVKRRRRKRRTKSRRKLVAKKQPTSRGRIARSLGIAKPKKGSTLPSVCRPSDHTLGSMRADIGAASFSVYGDPFDLDPFDNGEEEDEEQTQVTSLLDAKRRGLSRSALRSHQPVARPITAGLSRGGQGQPQAEEAAPVPDLLGSILTGQSMLMMDSSDVVINRDGSLKAVKPVSSSSPSIPGSSSRSSSSGETGPPGPPGQSPNPGPSFGDLAGPSHSPRNPPLPHSSPGPSSSSPLNPSPPSPSLTNHSHTAANPHPSSLGHPRLQPAPPSHRPSPTAGPSHRGTNGVGPPHRGHPSTSGPHSHSKGREAAPPQSQAKKAAPPKPVWVDVSVLPRIPKIKRETNGIGNDSATRGSSSSNGFPESGMQSLAGNRGRQHSADQQQGRQDGQTPRHRPGPPSAFASSFSSSSLSGSPANPPPPSTSSSTICFRINSSGSAWHARPLANASAMAGGSSEEDEAAKKRGGAEPRRPGWRARVKEERAERDAYDPFHPTGSESDGSGGEPESRAAADCKSQRARGGSGLPDVGGGAGFRKQVKAEVPERRISPEGEGVSGERVEVKTEPEPSGIRDCGRTNRSPQRAPQPGASSSTNSLPHRLVPVKTEKPEPAEESSLQSQTSTSSLQRRATSASSSASTSASSLPGERRLKTEVKQEPGDSPAGSPSRSSGRGRQVSGGSGASRERQSASSSPEPDRRRRGGHPDSGQAGRRRKGEERGSGEAGRRRGEAQGSGEVGRRRGEAQGSGEVGSRRGEGEAGRRRGEEEGDAGRRRGQGSGEAGRSRRGEEGSERRTRRSGSRDRRRRSPSDSSDSGASERSRRKRRSRDGRRSRSGSDSSSREPRKSKKQKRGESRERRASREGARDGGRVAKDERYARSRSASRSRSRERRKEPSRPPPSSSGSKGKVDSRSGGGKRLQSRSRSRETRKGEGSSAGSSKGPQKMAPTLATSDLSKEQQGRKREKKLPGITAQEGTEREVKRGASSSNSGQKPLSVSEVKGERNHRDGWASANPVQEPQVAKAIKKEKLTCFDIFGEDSTDDEPVKDEKPQATSLSAIKDFYLKKEKEIKKENMRSPQNEPCTSATSAEKKEERVSIATVEIKTEPDLILASSVPPPPPPPAPAQAVPFPSPTPASLVAVPADIPPPPPAPRVKPETPAGVPGRPPAEEPSDSDEDFNVDMLLDSLDFVKSEKAAEREGGAAVVGGEVKQERREEEEKAEGEGVVVVGGVKQEEEEEGEGVVVVGGVKQEEEGEGVVVEGGVKQEEEEEEEGEGVVVVGGVKQERGEEEEEKAEGEGVVVGGEVKQEEEKKAEGEPVPGTAGAKSKAQVKRVTWNIQEPDGPQPEKTGSKLALYKLKLKQEGARRPSSYQDPSGALPSGDPSAQGSKKGSANSLAPAGLSIPGQGHATDTLSEATEEPRNNKYMKKLHMQERAVEEVKLAIKPFYQKRDITKDEYKDILRKAVQKVCHSKSGEINPVKVANLVKAYVDKYKHARKQGQGREDGETTQETETEGAKDSESP